MSEAPAPQATPEALRLAAWLKEGAWNQMRLGDVEAAGRELKRLHAENDRMAERIAELEARKPLPPMDMTVTQHVNALVGDGLTAQKVEAICEREPYDVTGVVLSLPDGRACIVNKSAVRWFSGASDFRTLMHGDPVAEERAACAKLCMDKAHKMEREAVDAEKEGDGTTRDDNRATAWVLAVCSQEILARGKPA